MRGTSRWARSLSLVRLLDVSGSSVSRFTLSALWAKMLGAHQRLRSSERGEAAVVKRQTGETTSRTVRDKVRMSGEPAESLSTGLG